jgi:hypothetical protein
MCDIAIHESVSQVGVLISLSNIPGSVRDFNPISAPESKRASLIHGKTTDVHDKI